ncbi:OmpH family outer membrane protein [Ostreibacterium oceani]|uniref:OmpH family outer membrane protein n=1 Tax=Ostreibacterium oceani TaxID=2654998 RepID=A0A6N7F051_9GAMM|nr:OmpH family outer membrane protein [Ostreibacterium oceani]MPV85216.1 hypothetical protein [Ostreibacterium oceani]
MIALSALFALSVRRLLMDFMSLIALVAVVTLVVLATLSQPVLAQTDTADTPNTPVVTNQQNAVTANENLKIGFVNIRQLLAQAPQLEQIRVSLAREFEAENQQLIQLQSDIATLNQRYDSIEAEQSNELLRLQQLIAEKQRELNRVRQLLQDEYSLRRNEALNQLQTLIVQMVARVSQDKNLDIVLNNTGVVYVSNRIDITPDVMAYLSEQSLD